MANVSKITPAEFGQDCEPKEVLADLLEKYRKPSFGSMSKRDVDIMMFEALQDLGIIKANPKIYDVMQLLHVTRAKARNLIYEVALRRMKSEDVMEEELRELLSKPILLKETDKVALEIDNPLLIDYLRKRLKGLNHLTDGSFSPELVKMEYDAFAHIYQETRTDLDKKQINKKLKELGIKTDFTVRTVITLLLQSGGKILAGKTGSDAAKDVMDVICDNWKDIEKAVREKKKELFEKPITHNP